MNKEEMRSARLRALGLEERERAAEESDPDRRAEKKERIEEDTHEGKASVLSPLSSNTSASSAPLSAIRSDMNGYLLTPGVLNSIREVLISGNTQEEDITRWLSQGCEFISSPAYCLKQIQGGPCGVLAAIQAELIKSVYFSSSCGDAQSHSPDEDGVYSRYASVIREMDPENLKNHFASALLAILKRAMTGSTMHMVYCDVSDINPGMWPGRLLVQPLIHETDIKDFIKHHLNIYESMVGCMVFVLSLILTRGLDCVANDMDDRSNGLIGSFGHCNQELVNLLLTGRATSNVFDGSKPLGDSGLVLKGVMSRSDIGYLTHLESMRYCQAGSYYKVPRYPIWVVGGSSHFTVLFSLNSNVNAETFEEKLLAKVKRQFRQADIDENGYIPMDKLREVLVQLDVNVSLSQDFESLKLLLDPENTGIILWGKFWSVVSQVLTGARIMDLVQNVGVAASSSSTTDMVVSSEMKTRERSDSELARALQDEWNNPEGSVLMDTTNAIQTPNVVPQQQLFDGRPRSDSDIARAMQEEWNAFPDGAMAVEEPPALSTPAPATSIGSLDIMSIISAASAPIAIAEPKSAPPAPAEPVEKITRADLQRHDSIADEKSESFAMYHYNGLERAGGLPQFSTFYLQKRDSSNAVGQEVAIDVNFGGAFTGFHSNPIEEVLKTRWPGCRLQWEGSPPNID